MDKKIKLSVNRESVEDAIDEGLEDYKNGRTAGPFRGVKEFRASLSVSGKKKIKEALEGINDGGVSKVYDDVDEMIKDLDS